LIYLTHARLMTESENTVREYANGDRGISQRVCDQLISSEQRYSLWFARHDRRMGTVADRKQRERQIITLRAVAVEQIHRTALVRYLRDYQITGTARDQTLTEFYGVLDPQRATVAEHKSYLIAASSQLCAFELLEMTGDRRGLVMLDRYQTAYDHYFSMFCDRARAARNGAPYLLDVLIPDTKMGADALRIRIVSGQLLPPKRFGGLQAPEAA
jgi:hypothetical protein